MISKPKYKLGRRLGAGVHDKCQTQKFALSEARHAKGAPRSRMRGRRRMSSEFGLQLLEKQKVRYSYGLTEKQLSRYVKGALKAKTNSTHQLFEDLEVRLDNAVYRLGLASSRSGARQLVSHGHFTVNNKKVTIPSYKLSISDVIAINGRSKNLGPFQDITKKLKNFEFPQWISFDPGRGEGKVKGKPKYEKTFFDLNAVLEFYSR